jgi:phosphoserine aminotransferase
VNGIANFSAGPAALPVIVQEQLLGAMANFRGTGLPVCSISHRDPVFEKVLERSIELVRELLCIPNDYEVLFLPGGATSQFKAWLLNLPEEIGDLHVGYIASGHWSELAMRAGQELEKDSMCTVIEAATSREDQYRRFPSIRIGRNMFVQPDGLDYVHMVTNETVNGTQVRFDDIEVDGPTLVADMSSDIMSRPFDVSKFGIIYAGAQKNLGIPGATLVIVRKDQIGPGHATLPAPLCYAEQCHPTRGKGGLRNTPDTVALCSVYYSLQWIKQNGGVAGMQQRAKERADTLYAAIDNSSAFVGIAQTDHRSDMNVTFCLRDQGRQAEFLQFCAAKGIVGIKGHAGADKYYGPHLRASLYNGQTIAAVERLIEIMNDFERRNA